MQSTGQGGTQSSQPVQRSVSTVCISVGVASLELAIREHFAGYRSHSSLLALASAIATMALLGIGLGVERVVAVAAGGAVFVAAFFVLRSAFRRRTGLAFRA